MNLRFLLGLLLAARTTARNASRILSPPKPKSSRRSGPKAGFNKALLAVVLGIAALFGYRGLNTGSWTIPHSLEDLLPTESSAKSIPSALPSITPPSVSSVGSAQNPAYQSLIIGSFNIQAFGRAKLGNPSVMGILVDIARRFDLLAIQELRSTEQDIIPKFVQMINADGSNFRYIVGPRQGYTISKEQYVYLFDANKLELVSAPYVAVDTTGQFHRAPLVAHFRSTESPPNQAFSFLLLNVHTDPDQIRFEIPELKTIIERVRQENATEDDVIILGDFNAPPNYFLPFHWFSATWAAIDDDWTTNVRENRNYDNIVFDRWATAEFTGRRGVLNFRRAYQLEMAQALEVSDHFPVWAEFSIFEAPRPSFTGNQGHPSLR